MSVTISRPTRRRPVFHPLPVAAIDRLTDDAVAITFLVPAELREQFAFRAGQHLTVRKVDDDARRSYSICSTPADLADTGLLRIGVKEIPGGVFSSYAAGALRRGDAIDVMPPLGKFTSAFEAGRRRHYGAIAAGSGITPVLSLVATALATEEHSRFTVLYGNRFARSVMFADELGDLKDRYAARLHLVHVLSQEPGESELLSGRIDADRLTRILDRLVPAGEVDEWFLCGPYGLVTDARNVLAGHRTVHTELFHVDEAPEPPRRPSTADDAAPVEVSVLLDGRVSTLRMRRDERVLDAALRVRSELPFACKGGVCSTCRARVVEGEVTMARNYALEPDELERGYVLTCQSSPVTDKLVVDYDA
ncbi:1,2-phenylacetyl-CoA epoxidase subunit PaaE [Asanoa sp. NPDC049518]|uniref:1,2-phenylacetyl-CoA epoxidase subunit PaaE n=1 Tax=unclassified Asanoa TaxID=2685164 RepID=UPI00343DC6DB